MLGAWLLQLPASPGNCQPFLNTDGQDAGADFKGRPSAIPTCDASAGKWQPKERPYYNGTRCANALFGGKFGCKKHTEGRGYERWRWQLEACSLPAATRERLDRLLAGRRMLFVGDSISRNMFASFTCLLMEVYGSEGVQVGRHGLAVRAAAEAAAAAAAAAGGGGGAGRQSTPEVAVNVTGTTTDPHAEQLQPVPATAAGDESSGGSGVTNHSAAGSAPQRHSHGPQHLLPPHRQYWVYWRERALATYINGVRVPLANFTLEMSPSPYLVEPRGAMDQVDHSWLDVMDLHAKQARDSGGGGGGPATHDVAAEASSQQLLVIGVGQWLLHENFIKYRGAAAPQHGNFTATTNASSGSSSGAAAPGAASHHSKKNANGETPEVELQGPVQALLAVAATVRRELARRAFRGLVFWLAQSPPHDGCEAASVGFDPRGGLRHQYDHDLLRRMHEAEAAAARDAGWQLLDITELSALRPDAHVAQSGSAAAGSLSRGKLDCVHWCLGGVPDTWVELLLLRLQELQEAVSLEPG